MIQLYWWTTQNHFSQRVQMSLRTHIKYSNAIKCHHKSKSQRTYHTASSGSWPLSRWGRSSTGQRDHSSITYTPNLRERHTQCLLRHRAGIMCLTASMYIFWLCFPPLPSHSSLLFGYFLFCLYGPLVPNSPPMFNLNCVVFSGGFHCVLPLW